MPFVDNGAALLYTFIDLSEVVLCGRSAKRGTFERRKMSILQEIEEGLKLGLEEAKKPLAGDFTVVERHMIEGADEGGNAVAFGDNEEYMKWLLSKGYAGKFRLIYIDPPFFTKAKYDATIKLRDKDSKKHNIRHLAYDDTFDRDLTFYIKNMTSRLYLMRELLADDGLLWVHLDWHSSHYIKIVLDELFGPKFFQNEIIWKYKSGGTGKRHFSRKHDTILVYSKTAKYFLNVPQEKSYNRGLKPYRFKGVEEYRDRHGWYTMVNMKDVWAIDMLGRTSHERTGYATQKPVDLMKRIIESSSEPGDLCGDFFCGSGSFLEAAEISGRRWIGCDSEKLAIGSTKKRLGEKAAAYDYYKIQDAEESAEDGVTSVFEMEKNREEELGTGKKLYSYRVSAFLPHIDQGHISFKDRELVDEIRAESPEQFIDYIMVDTDHDGRFLAEMTVTGGFDDIKFISRGNVAFIAVDIFGREYFYEDKGR